MGWNTQPGNLKIINSMPGKSENFETIKSMLIQYSYSSSSKLTIYLPIASAGR